MPMILLEEDNISNKSYPNLSMIHSIKLKLNFKIIKLKKELNILQLQ